MPGATTTPSRPQRRSSTSMALSSTRSPAARNCGEGSSPLTASPPRPRCSPRSAGAAARMSSPKHLHRFGPGLTPDALRRDLRRLDEETGLPEARLMRGARTLLNRLRDAGIPTALVTSGSLRYATHHLTRLGVADHFRTLVTADDVTHGKPDPEGYLLACRRLGVDPRQALVFEDSAAGIPGSQGERSGLHRGRRPVTGVDGGDVGRGARPGRHPGDPAGGWSGVRRPGGSRPGARLIERVSDTADSPCLKPQAASRKPQAANHKPPGSRTQVMTGRVR